MVVFAGIVATGVDATSQVSGATAVAAAVFVVTAAVAVVAACEQRLLPRDSCAVVITGIVTTGAIAACEVSGATVVAAAEAVVAVCQQQIVPRIDATSSRNRPTSPSVPSRASRAPQRRPRSASQRPRVASREAQAPGRRGPVRPGTRKESPRGGWEHAEATNFTAKLPPE